jgi:O-antigen/teichoic acid export membrane protein
MSWTIVAQGISFASMLLLPRIFDHTEFGIFAVFSGLVVMVGIVAAGRFEFAIGLPAKDLDASTLFTLCAILSVVVSAAFFLIAMTFPLPDRFPQLAVLNSWWVFVAIGAICIAWYNAASYMAVRVGGFSIVGKSKAVIALVTGLGQIIAGAYVTRHTSGLIVPFLLGQLAGALVLIAFLWKRGLWQFDRLALRSVAQRYIRFPMYIASGSLFDGLAVLLPVAGITALYSPAHAGIYALAERTLRVPVTLIGSSVLQVFYKRIAEVRGDAVASRRLLVRTWTRMALIAIGPCVGIAIFGQPVFSFLFGAAWRESGHVAQIMSFSTLFYFVSYPTSNTLVVNERAKTYLFWQALQLLTMGAALWIVAEYGRSVLADAVICIVIAQAILYLWSMALQWRSVDL